MASNCPLHPLSSGRCQACTQTHNSEYFLLIQRLYPLSPTLSDVLRPDHWNILELDRAYQSPFYFQAYAWFGVSLKDFWSPFHKKWSPEAQKPDVLCLLLSQTCSLILEPTSPPAFPLFLIISNKTVPMFPHSPPNLFTTYYCCLCFRFTMKNRKRCGYKASYHRKKENNGKLSRKLFSSVYVEY